MQVTRNKAATAPGPGEWFTGTVYLDPVAAPSGSSRVSASSVHFTPGARTAWHSHPHGQTIYVTEGVGLAQGTGGPIEVIRPGDSVFFEPGEYHWHGAAPNRFMTISRCSTSMTKATARRGARMSASRSRGRRNLSRRRNDAAHEIDDEAPDRRAAFAGCVYAEDEAALVLDHLRASDVSPTTEDGKTLLRDYARRRRTGEPPEYILGWAEFAGMHVAVGPGVFIPRRWCEALMLRAVELLDTAVGGTAVELGSGSGAIALAIHSRSPGSRVWDTESNAAAARWVVSNCAGRPGLTICTGDLYDALPASLLGQVDVFVGSLPYVPRGELDTLPRDHLISEPLVAFDGGEQGLATVSRALVDAHRWLRRSGSILLEIGHSQGTPASAIAAESGLTGILIRRDQDGGELFLEARL